MVGFGSPETKPLSTPRHLLDKYFPSAAKEDSFIHKRLDWEISDPFEIYSRLRPNFENSFILESSTGPEELAKYTFMGFDPKAVLTLNDGRFKENGKLKIKTSRPLNYLKTLEEDFRNIYSPENKRYLGGLVGYLSYDFVRYLEDLPKNKRSLNFPDLQMGLYLDGLLYDHRQEELSYFSYGKDRSAKLEELLHASSEAKKNDFRMRKVSSDFTGEEFNSAIADAKSYIGSGDIYQTVISRKLTGRFAGDPFRTYRKLREINPSPYMYHLKFGDRRIIGSSPEKLVSVRGGDVITYPIAGTRPLGENDREREKLRKDLISDEKERAEHNMLVDLARNDVGRVSRYGTIEVPEYMETREFSHVQHMVTKVTGKLAENKMSFDALASMFPAGTVSGAPKIRAMEIIDELEATPRGPYAGAVGYLSFNGNLDSCITIRSLYTKDNRISLRAGAGIVADSVAEKEWEEINHKLGALRQALFNRGGEK